MPWHKWHSPLPGLHARLDLHHLVRDVHHADGDVAGLRVVLSLEVVVDPRLQVVAQLGLRESWVTRAREREGERQANVRSEVRS